MKIKIDSECVEIFRWCALYETGVSAIDCQNKALVCVFNKMAWKMVSDPMAVVVGCELEGFVDYVELHHKFEEQMWRGFFSDDLWLRLHVQGHEEFKNKMSSLVRASSSGLPAKVSSEIALKFISKWLVLHLLESDSLMSNVVSNLLIGESLERAKELASMDLAKIPKSIVSEIVSMQDSVVGIAMRLSGEILNISLKDG